MFYEKAHQTVGFFVCPGKNTATEMGWHGVTPFFYT